jgi:hypothetical protein
VGMKAILLEGKCVYVVGLELIDLDSNCAVVCGPVTDLVGW